MGKYSQKEKAQVCKYAREYNAYQAMKRYGIPEMTIGRWLKADHPKKTTNTDTNKSYVSKVSNIGTPVRKSRSSLLDRPISELSFLKPYLLLIRENAQNYINGYEGKAVKNGKTARQIDDCKLLIVKINRCLEVK